MQHDRVGADRAEDIKQQLSSRIRRGSEGVSDHPEDFRAHDKFTCYPRPGPHRRLLGLIAYGYNRGDRAASGALIGAAGGAGIAALTGGAPLVGADIGAGAGAIGGAVTSGHHVNLGRPIWR
jgi:hypothetical protein